MVTRYFYEPQRLPPLTGEEREEFANHFARGWVHDRVFRANTDAEAIKELTRIQNGGSVGPIGWNYRVTAPGKVVAILCVPPPGAVPNRHGVLLGEPVRAATFTFAEIVGLIRHGLPPTQMALLDEWPGMIPDLITGEDVQP